MTRRLPLMLMIFLGASSALAQGSDLAVTIDANDAQPALEVQYAVRVTWTGPEFPRDVVLDVELPSDIVFLSEFDPTWRCRTTARSLQCMSEHPYPYGAGVDIGIRVRVSGPGTYTANAQVSSATPDPQPENNRVSHSVVVAGLPLLTVSATGAGSDAVPVDADADGTMFIGVQNDGATATGVVLRATLPEGGRFTSAEPHFREPADVEVSCTTTTGEVACVIPELAAPGFVSILVRYVTPDRVTGGTFPFLVTVDADQADYFPGGRTYRRDVLLRRLLAVTSATDGGEGSLRQAMLDANALCLVEPCTIRIDTGMGPLQPLTPLPTLRGSIRIDGGADRSVLDGSLLDSGAIYYETGCELTIDRMIIRNFKGHAIEAHQTREDRFSPACGFGAPFVVAVTVSRSELTGNLRGIVTKNVSASITNNVIRDHVRAGIFVDGGYYSNISGNEITGNGASGIFINASDESAYGIPSGADVDDNIVRGNGHWGVCRTANGMVRIRQNSISGNLVYGIDLNLDLDTPNRETDIPGVPNKPVLISAFYDPARDKTVVRGRMDTTSSYDYSVMDFYAGSLSVWGYPEAARAVASLTGSGEFAVELSGDLRGQWITATFTRMFSAFFAKPPRGVTADAERPYSYGNTSELSNAVPVL